MVENDDNLWFNILVCKIIQRRTTAFSMRVLICNLVYKVHGSVVLEIYKLQEKVLISWKKYAILYQTNIGDGFILLLCYLTKVWRNELFPSINRRGEMPMHLQQICNVLSFYIWTTLNFVILWVVSVNVSLGMVSLKN